VRALVDDPSKYTTLLFGMLGPDSLRPTPVERYIQKDTPSVARRLVAPLSAPRARRSVHDGGTVHFLVVRLDQDRATCTSTLRAERGVPSGALRVAGGLRTKACGAVHVGLRGVVHRRERVVVAHCFYPTTARPFFFHDQGRFFTCSRSRWAGGLREDRRRLRPLR
jgi:hypothetical protein